MSKNTTHCWKVVDMGNYYRLYHAHKYEDGYHLHGQYGQYGQYGLMIDCVLDIVEHDEWKLNIWRHRNKGRFKQLRTYFDMLVETYCRVPAYA